MPNGLLKRFARIHPYTRRIQDGLQAMRGHIGALEARAAQAESHADRMTALVQELQAQLDTLQLHVMPPAESVPAIEAVPAVDAVHYIDQAWCDASGVFVEGWAHAGPRPVRLVALMCGGERVETTAFCPRPDVSAYYPGLPPGGAVAFSMYLACAAYQPLVLSVVTDAGSAEMAVRLPAPGDAGIGAEATPAFDGFLQAMRARRGTVLELGARIVGSMTQGWRPRFEPECRYLGNDIHPGPGIDVVGDAHSLTGSVAPGSLDGVFSVAVLEHLAAPWLAAAEINRALRIGGETVHVTHQSWPVHETPNDFFRMSDAALRSLFGAATGFEVVASGMAFPMAIIPAAHMRHADWLNLPFGQGFGQSHIRARKVAELDRTASLWGVQDLGRISQEYPKPR